MPLLLNGTGTSLIAHLSRDLGRRVMKIEPGKACGGEMGAIL